MAVTTLKKALPQDRYIKIVSTNIGTREFSDRDFGGLVFTETDTILVNGKSKTFDTDKMVVVYSAEQARSYFGTDSVETNIATQYFGYRSPRGFSPRRLSFVRKLAGETPKAAIENLNGLSNNFGGFMFAQSEGYTCSDMKDVIEYVHGLDHKYLFSLAIPCENKSEGTSGVASKTIGEVNAVDFVDYLADGQTLPTYEGTCVWLGYKYDADAEVEESDSDASDVEPLNSAISAFMPLAILGAVRYSGTNTVTNYMFKQFPSQSYTVDDENLANAYDEHCVNYIGLVQSNGTRRAFSQQGYNIDGTATNVYCNELWLKSEVATAILNLFTEAEVVSAGSDGTLLIYNTIAASAADAVANGAISVGKTLDDDQKIRVYQLTNDPDAWRTIQESGWWLNVDIVRVTESGKTFYKAMYLLIYSKDDAILKVEGQHALV